LISLVRLGTVSVAPDREKVSLASSLGVPDLMAESMEVMKLEKPFFMDSRPELISLVRLGTVSVAPDRAAALLALFEADEIDCVWDWDCVDIPVSGRDPWLAVEDAIVGVLCI